MIASPVTSVSSSRQKLLYSRSLNKLKSSTSNNNFNKSSNFSTAGKVSFNITPNQSIYITFRPNLNISCVISRTNQANNTTARTSGMDPLKMQPNRGIFKSIQK